MQRKILLIMVLLLVTIIPAQAQRTDRASESGSYGDFIGTRPVYLVVMDDFAQTRDYTEYAQILNTSDYQLLRNVVRGIVKGRTYATFADLLADPDFAHFYSELRERLVSVVPNEDTCSMTPDQSAFMAMRGSAFMAMRGSAFMAMRGSHANTGEYLFNTVPHGERVTAAAEFALSNTSTGRPVEVMRVDTNGFSMIATTQRLRKTLERIAYATGADAAVVVNLSFNLVPCEYIPTIAAYDALFWEVWSVNPASAAALDELYFNMRSDMQAMLNALYASDPLLNFIFQSCAYSGYDFACQGEDGSISEPLVVSYVGSAGNGAVEFDGARIDFPFDPAAAYGIVSVAANGPNTMDERVWTNWLDKTEDFVYTSYMYPYRAVFANAGAWIFPGKFRGEPGSSFAAPQASAWIASAFAEVSDACGYRSADIFSLTETTLGDDWRIGPTVVNEVAC